MSITFLRFESYQIIEPEEGFRATTIAVVISIRQILGILLLKTAVNSKWGE